VDTAGAACSAATNSGAPRRLGQQRQGAAVALARAGSQTIAYVADEDDHAIHTMDVDGGRTRATTRLAGAPAQVLVLADGRVAVTLRDKNRVQLLSSSGLDSPLTPLCSVKAPAEPVALAATPDDRTLLVTSAWAKQLTGFASDTMATRFVADVVREPRDVVVDDDGQRAFVAHVVGGKVSVIDLTSDAHEVRQIDLHVPKTGGSRPGTSTRESCQGFALAKSHQRYDDAKPALPAPENMPLSLEPAPVVPKGRIFAPRVTIDPGEPSRRSSGYGNSRFARVETPIVSVIDAAAERNLTTALIDTSARHQTPFGECLLPRAATLSASTGGLLVTCLGSDALVELDPRGSDPSRLERRRWKTPAGPIGVAVDDSRARAVVWSQFDRQLAVIDLAAKASPDALDLITAPKLAKGTLSASATWGRKLFHQTDDARMSGDGRACASCHPDGREDALTWSTPVGPRQTIMLAGRVKGSAPFSWLGVHADEKIHLRTTFERLGGTGLSDRHGELDALVAYLHEMPGPVLDGALREPQHASLADKGKRLFHHSETGCATCHVGGGTDQKSYDLGTKSAADQDDAFDTPSLRYVAGTAPYFHDGRYGSLLELLTSTDSQMGHTMHLSRNDALALAAYLETL
jgi:cytochrome c553